MTALLTVYKWGIISNVREILINQERKIYNVQFPWKIVDFFLLFFLTIPLVRLQQNPLKMNADKNKEKKYYSKDPNPLQSNIRNRL